MPRIVKAIVREAGADGVARQAAGLAYFAIFAMPGLLVLTIGVAAPVFGWSAAKGRVLDETKAVVGEEGARTVGDILTASAQPRGSTTVARILGALGLVIGATGFFLQFQDSLNAMWGAKGNERRRGVAALIRKRLLSLGMVLALAVLLLVSLTLSALLSALGDRLTDGMAERTSARLLSGVELAVTFALATLLFAAVYKVLPDIRIEWREVWVGAAVTALLFVVGKAVIGFYIGRSDPGSAYGAAGPLVVLLAWIYYSTLAMLVGAEFTQVYARLYGPHSEQRSRRMAKKAALDPRVDPEKGPRDARKAG